MSTAAAVGTPIDLYRLGIAFLGFAFCSDMTQLPPIMADIVMLILKHGICHVVILPDVFFIRPGLALLMILELDLAAYSFFLQVQQVLFTAVPAVSRHRLQAVPKCFLMFFQDRDQRIIIRSVIAYLTMENEIILYCVLDVIGRL